MVDFVIIYNKLRPSKLLRLIKPGFYIISENYPEISPIENEIIKELEIKVKIIKNR